eukprot:7387517-Prymnesium_polylepis.2
MALVCKRYEVTQVRRAAKALGQPRSNHSPRLELAAHHRVPERDEQCLLAHRTQSHRKSCNSL